MSDRLEAGGMGRTVCGSGGVMREVLMPDFEMPEGGILSGGVTHESESYLRLWWRSSSGRAEIRVSLRSLANLGAAALRNRTRRASSAGHLARREA